MSKFLDVPLHQIGDAIVEAYSRAGIAVAISVTVVSLDSPGVQGGQVSSTSNIPEEDERALLRWVVEQREKGSFDKESFGGETIQ